MLREGVLGAAHPPRRAGNRALRQCANPWPGSLRGKNHERRRYRASNELACNELVELVTDYLEERLPDLDVERLEAHLSICAGAAATTSSRCGRRSTRSATFLREPLAPEVREELLGGV